MHRIKQTIQLQQQQKKNDRGFQALKKTQKHHKYIKS